MRIGAFPPPRGGLINYMDTIVVGMKGHLRVDDKDLKRLIKEKLVQLRRVKLLGESPFGDHIRRTVAVVTEKGLRKITEVSQ